MKQDWEDREVSKSLINGSPNSSMINFLFNPLKSPHNRLFFMLPSDAYV